MFRWLDLRWTRPSNIELKVLSYNDWTVYHEIFVDCEYDPAIHRALSMAPVNRPLRVLDLGANVGYFTLRVIDRARIIRGAGASVQVTAVEPRPDSIADFKERVFDENGLERSIELVEGLVGRPEGQATLMLAPSPCSSTIMQLTGEPSLEVRFVNLSAVVANVPEIDLVKCDIEGAELLLLEHHADVFRKSRVVIFELHDDLCDSARCRERLRALGFVEQPGLRSRGGVSLYLGVRFDGAGGAGRAGDY